MHLSEKQTTFSAKMMTRKTLTAKGSVPASEDTYPEIEKLFPFNPLHFESFNLPEELDRTAPLDGVPLMIVDEDSTLEKLLYLGPLYP